MSSSLDLRDIEAFVSVADSGSFTGAAQALLLSQPTISSRIASLEESLGTKLIDRAPGKVRPTPAGEVLLPRAKLLLSDRDGAVQAVGAYLGTISGKLIVGASSVPGTYLLPQVLGNLLNENPGLRAALHVTDTERALEALSAGDVELAVVGREIRDVGLSTTVIGGDEIVLVAIPEIARAFNGGTGSRVNRLSGVPLILRERGSGTRTSVLDVLARAGCEVSKLKVQLEIGDNAAARAAALGGVGAVFLSRLCVEEDLRTGKLVEMRVLEAPLRRPFVVVTRSFRTPAPAAAELIRRLGEQAGLVEKRAAPRPERTSESST